MPKAEKKKYQQDLSETPVTEPNQNPTAAPTEEEIAVRAYHIYLERGGTEGNPDDDWLQAERDLITGAT